MASDKTTNYGWTKIDPEGAVDVATDVNTPLDEIDASLKSVADDTVSTSDLAELETKVANAQSTADSANTAATNAQNTANAANTAATNAQSAADTANTAATNAMTLAETNETDIATLDAEMAGTADSGLKTLITNNTTNISTNTTNISTLTEQMAGTTDSGLKALIDAKKSPELFLESFTGTHGTISIVFKNTYAIPPILIYSITQSATISSFTFTDIEVSTTGAEFTFTGTPSGLCYLNVCVFERPE